MLVDIFAEILVPKLLAVVIVADQHKPVLIKETAIDALVIHRRCAVGAGTQLVPGFERRFDD